MCTKDGDGVCVRENLVDGVGGVVFGYVFGNWKLGVV